METPEALDREVVLRRLVEGVNNRTGVDLTYLGVADLGETAGAAFVTWPDGRHGVVTTATVPADVMRRTAGILPLARSRGVPVPELELVVGLDDDIVAVVQERLPGRHPTLVDADLIDTLVDANDGFAGLLVDRLDVPVPPLHLAHSGQVFPRHETLENHDDRSRRLLRRIRELGSRDVHEMAGDDLIHPDFTVPNILMSKDGRVTGIVDWNNGGWRGDRWFALVKLLFDLAWDGAAPDGGRHHIQPSALERLESTLHSRVDAEVLELYWAHWTLTMLHWTIRSGDPEVIDLHLELGERGLSC